LRPFANLCGPFGSSSFLSGTGLHYSIAINFSQYVPRWIRFITEPTLRLFVAMIPNLWHRRNIIQEQQSWQRAPLKQIILLIKQIVFWWRYYDVIPFSL